MPDLPHDTMSPETWGRIDELLLEALDLPEPRREEFLAAIAARDPRTAEEVRSLLAADTGAIEALDRPFVDLVGSAEALEPGSRVGPYRTTHEIGRGGSGVVYAAHRADGELERQVAVKVLKKGMDSADLVRRFRNERQILANLEHPNIAKLFEGGTTDDHRPYFVMEHVDGEPIDVYCDRRAATVEERLRIFVKVCSAVDRAHRSLVIHRDLKPSNILVADDGEPKLLDFGIAKLLEPAGDRSMPRTATGRYLMTPEYASPEQVRGDALTTSTDVYSLGVLLFELLTGRRPYRLRSRSLEEALLVVCRQEPERPSVVVIREAGDPPGTVPPEEPAAARGDLPRRLRKRLAGDLDNIVLKALRKEPSRRYRSARELADDIERHLDGRPVRARADTLTYRTGKWLRRHKTETVALLGVLLLTTFWGFERLDQQQRLQRERDRAQRISQFLVDLFRVADPSEARGNEVTAREILDRGVLRIDQDLAEDPALRAALTRTTAQVYRNLGLYDEAEDLAETAVRLERELPGPDPENLAEALVVRATLHFDQGRIPEAEALLREALDLRRQSLGASHPSTVVTLNDVAVMLERQGKYDEAEPLFRQVLDRQRSLHGPDHPKVAQTLSNLGVLLQNLQDLDGAEAAFRESLAIKRDRLGAVHPGTALGLNNLALLLTEKGELDEARELFAEALDAARKVYGDEHPNVAKSLSNLAGAYQKSGHLDLAEETYSASLAMRREVLGAEHPGIARDLILLARLSLEQEDPAEAELRAREAVEVLPEEDVRLRPLAENLLGSCLLELGRTAEARPLLEGSYRALLDSRGADSPATLRATRRLVELYETLGLEELAHEARGRLPAGSD